MSRQSPVTINGWVWYQGQWVPKAFYTRDMAQRRSIRDLAWATVVVSVVGTLIVLAILAAWL